MSTRHGPQCHIGLAVPDVRDALTSYPALSGMTDSAGFSRSPLRACARSNETGKCGTTRY